MCIANLSKQIIKMTKRIIPETPTEENAREMESHALFVIYGSQFLTQTLNIPLVQKLH